jgi:beta-glucanase (GH16 family)
MNIRKDLRFHFTRNLPGPRAITLLQLIVLFTFLLGWDSDFCPVAYAGDPTGWRLVWSDEFDGTSGSPVDSNKWSFDIGGKGWGNNELETYTNRTANADLEGGSLVIKALKETYTGRDNITRNYTSARLLTRNKFTQTYGRFEARIKLPFGKGLWPAFWMLGDNIGTVGWPTCGEIDIMENIGKEPSTVHGTFHGPGYSGAKGVSAAYKLPNGQKFADDFHAFAVEWEPNVMRFYVDGLLYKTRTPSDVPAGTTWVFNHPFFIILNVAVGGGFPGNPDATTVFPQLMKVDYVRVYERTIPTSRLLLTDGSSSGAPALDLVPFKRDPFSVSNTYTTRLDLVQQPN